MMMDVRVGEDHDGAPCLRVTTCDLASIFQLPSIGRRQERQIRAGVAVAEILDGSVQGRTG